MNKINKLKEINDEINVIIRDLQAKCFVLTSDYNPNNKSNHRNTNLST